MQLYCEGPCGSEESPDDTVHKPERINSLNCTLIFTHNTKGIISEVLSEDLFKQQSFIQTIISSFHLPSSTFVNSDLNVSCADTDGKVWVTTMKADMELYGHSGEQGLPSLSTS